MVSEEKSELEMETEYAKERVQQKVDFLETCKKLLENPDEYVQGFLRLTLKDGSGVQPLFGFVSAAELVGIMEIVKAGTIASNVNFDEEQEQEQE